MSRLVLTQITIKKERSISSTTWYYLLQPSNASAPDPTNYGNPPPIYSTTGYSGWSTTEPTYTVGDDRVLYVMVQTLYSDGTFSYSTPSISSSYEAAKDAYNEIIQAETTIEQFEELGLKKGYIWDNETYVPASGSIPVYPIGTYIASGILVNGNRSITRSNSNTYGLNTWISTGGINLRYNAIDLMKLTTSNLEFYYPSTSSQQKKAISLGTNGAVNSLAFYGFNSDKKTMELTNNGLHFYNPSDGSTELASFTTNGLVLSKGGIQVGSYNASATDANQNFIYLSSENYGSNVKINNVTKSNWRQIIGNKFGVDNAGNLYASNVNISGTITVGSGSTIDSNATIGGTSASTVVSNASTGAQAASDLSNFETTVSNTYATQISLQGVADQIPNDISDLTDTTGIIPNDLSDLTDTTNIISNAVNTGVSGKADKTDAIQEEQLIYIQAISGTNSVAAYPSSATTTSSYWVTQSGESIPNGTPPDSATGQTPRWTTKRPSYQKNYPVIFTAKQKKTVSGSITCTTPLKDDTLTIIDGGHITTGSIDGQRITANTVNAGAIKADSGTFNTALIPNLSADKITSGDIAAARIQTNLITAINAKVSDISALSATLGGFQVDSTAIHTNGVAITSNADNSIALSSADFTRTINSTSREGLRFAIGDKFGVTGDGILYASSGIFNGRIEASEGYISGGVTIGSGGTSITNSLASKASSSAEYEVIIKVDSIDYTAPQAVLIAVPTKLGATTTGTFTWYKNTIGTAHGGTVSTTTTGNTNDTLTVTDLAALYIAVLQ